jgi:hypothetical protein
MDLRKALIVHSPSRMEAFVDDCTILIPGNGLRPDMYMPLVNVLSVPMPESPRWDIPMQVEAESPPYGDPVFYPQIPPALCPIVRVQLARRAFGRNNPITPSIMLTLALIRE